MKKATTIINTDTDNHEVTYDVKKSKNEILYNRLKALDKHYLEKLDMVNLSVYNLVISQTIEDFNY